jgi:hypothetical protein
MTRSYTIGGVRFLCDRVLPDLNEDGFSDLDINVAISDIRPVTHMLAGPDGTTGSFDQQERTLSLLDQGDAGANSWLLRQIAPIVSSVSSRLVLHTSAALLRQGVVAFVGESGAGKSTLAQAFPVPVADDLVAVRFDDSVLVPVGDTLTPLVAVYFLERREDRLATELLPAAEALELEIANGFGEHGDPDTWAFQFDAYHRLTETVPHHRLTIPDDLAALPSVVEFVESRQ